MGLNSSGSMPHTTGVVKSRGSRVNHGFLSILGMSESGYKILN